mmetsp:Transcript_12842/g.36096  ORF Transcript_12842/g.36096 Transcript_12842/m.36096 type:complete len:292 (-) Transcript_12842:2122-2997(-)
MAQPHRGRDIVRHDAGRPRGDLKDCLHRAVSGNGILREAAQQILQLLVPHQWRQNIALKHFCGCRPVGWVWIGEPADHVGNLRVVDLPVGRQLAGLPEVAKQFVALHASFEGVPHLEHNYPKAVDVHLLVVLCPTLCNLRADVDSGPAHPGGVSSKAIVPCRSWVRGASAGCRPADAANSSAVVRCKVHLLIQPAARAAVLGEAEVPQLDVSLCIVEDVGRLEVAVDDPLAVHVGKCCQNLPEHLPRIDLLKASVLVDDLMEGTGAELHLYIKHLLDPHPSSGRDRCRREA